MLMTTSPVLPGRAYWEVAGVVGDSPSLMEGPTPSMAVNGYLRAVSLLEWHATQFSADAVIDVRIAMNGQGYWFLTGMAIRFHPQSPSSVPPWRREEQQSRSSPIWNFLRDLTQDL